MNKSEELAALDQFISALPADCYLRPILAESRPFIERDMLADLACPTIGQLIENRRQLESEIKAQRLAWQAEAQDMARERDEWQTVLRGARRELETIQTSARIIFARKP